EGVADYLACLVALYTLGALVPARDPAVTVEQENGVVEVALHEQRGTLLGGEQLIFHVLRLIDLLGHLGETGCLALAIAHGADHDIGPEAGTVLAHAPAFVLDPAVARGDLQFSRKGAVRSSFGWVEHGEMPANDFRGTVSLDPLSAGIPGHDATRPVEREDGVVRHAVYEMAVG